MLGLLLEEFPDVTISKIRFLESQGLIEPERTPSGYRKFYDHDVQLLGLILREQRENFLPLRVIKDRIDSGEILAEEQATAPRGIRNVTTAAAAKAGQSGDRLPGLDDGATAGTGTGTERPVAGEPLLGAPAEPPAPTLDRNASTPDDAAPTGEDDVSEDDTDKIEQAAEPDMPAPRPTKPKVTKPRATKPKATQPDATAPETERERTGNRHRRPRNPTRQNSSAQSPPMDSSTPPSSPARQMPPQAQIDALCSYGLISTTNHLGDALFDEDAVAVTSLCARLMDLGIDARHLRGWRTSADREVGLFEGLTLPLLRQRNPHGRELARDRLVELNDLGTKLRGTLMDIALRQHFAP
ncbi:MAG: MerR family transcriptional regulator [Ilumatobacteraceae bacterium]